MSLGIEVKQALAQIVSELETLINSLEALADEQEEAECTDPKYNVVDWDGETPADTLRLAAEALEEQASVLSQL